jgi:23S rRNA maturation-related 3'-5' exoribonuclease YhaM
MDLKDHGLSILNPYIEQINDPNIKELTIACLERAPNYFWSRPAAVSGKYHPKFVNCQGGTVKHTAFAVYLGIELCNTFDIGKGSIQMDRIISALILHDTFKSGYSDNDDWRYGLFHPFIPRKAFEKDCSMLSKHFNWIMTLIESHMGNIGSGAWTPGGVQPMTKEAEIVHLADYIASRRELDWDNWEIKRNLKVKTREKKEELI